MSMPGTLRMAMIRGNKRKRIALVIVALLAALAGAAPAFRGQRTQFRK